MVRWMARRAPDQTQVALARATSPVAVATASTSRSETMRSKVRTVRGAALRAVASTSGSEPPSLRSGLRTAFNPVGRSSRVAIRAAPTRPASPRPLR